MLEIIRFIFLFTAFVDVLQMKRIPLMLYSYNRHFIIIIMMIQPTPLKTLGINREIRTYANDVLKNGCS